MFTLYFSVFAIGILQFYSCYVKMDIYQNYKDFQFYANKTPLKALSLECINIVHSIYNFKIQVTFIFNEEIYEQNNIWIANSKLYMY